MGLAASALAQLWVHGADGADREIERRRREEPAAQLPHFLRTVCGATLCCALWPEELDEAVALLKDVYWNEGYPPEVLRRSLEGATPCVGARDPAGRLIAHARVLSDGAKVAWLYDVIVAPAWRGRGLGEAVVRLALDHPKVRSVRQVWLRTRDAQPLYRKLGFIDRSELPPLPYSSSEMVLRRAPNATSENGEQRLPGGASVPPSSPPSDG